VREKPLAGKGLRVQTLPAELVEFGLFSKKFKKIEKRC
jgi:hypothetical protein